MKSKKKSPINLKKTTKKLRKKTATKTPKKSLSKFGMNSEIELIEALNSSNNNAIVKWICQYMNYTKYTKPAQSRGVTYTIYNIYRRTNSPSFKKTTKNLDNIFVITSDKFIGQGSWGKVYDAYIFDKDYLS